MSFNLEEDEEWDVELIQDLVRKEEEAVAAKRATQISSFPNVDNAYSFPIISTSNSKNPNAAEASLDAYMYSFSPPRGFNEGQQPRLHGGKPEGIRGAFDDGGAQLGFQNKQIVQENQKPESGTTFQINRNVELLQRELECLSEQLLFQDQEKLELYRERDEKDAQLRKALEAVAAKDAEIERLKKMRQTEGREQTDNMGNTSRAHQAENCSSPDLAQKALGEVLMLGTANGISNIDDTWSPPWATKGTTKEAIGIGARSLAATSKNLCWEEKLSKNKGFDAKDDQIGCSPAAEMRAPVLIEHVSNKGHDSNPSQVQELPCRQTTALPKSGRTRGSFTDLYQDVQSCKMDTLSGLSSLSNKLCAIWDPSHNKRWGTNLVSKLFVSCGVELYMLLRSTHGSPKDHNITKLKDMLCNESPEGEHAIHAAEVGEAKKMHFLSQNLFFILAKLVNAMVPLEALIETLLEFCTAGNVQIVQSALCILNCTLRDEYYLKREDPGSRTYLCSKGSFPEARNSLKVDSEMLRLHDSSQLASNGNLPHANNDIASFPLFSSRIHCRSKELISEDWNANIDNDLDQNKPPANQSSYMKQTFRGNQGGCNICTVKWLTLFRTMHQIALENESMDVKLQAVSLMNLIVTKSDPNSEREKFGPILFYRSLSQLLQKEVGLNVQLQAVRLLFLLLNCPRLLKLFCGCKEDLQNYTEKSDIHIDITQVDGGYEMVLEALAECISCPGNGVQEYTLCRHALHVLAFIAASGNMGVACLLSFMHSSSKGAQERPTRDNRKKYGGPSNEENAESHNPDINNEKAVHSPKNSNDMDQQMLNIPMLLVALLNSELDAEEAEDVKLGISAETSSKERTTLIQEALILLHGLASHSLYSARVLTVLTNDKIVSRLCIGVLNRIVGKTLNSQRVKRFQKTHSNQVDTIELAHELWQKMLPYVTDTWQS